MHGRPAVYLDATYVQRTGLNPSGPSGELTVTYSLVSNQRFDVILAANMSDSYALDLSLLNLDMPSLDRQVCVPETATHVLVHMEWLD